MYIKMEIIIDIHVIKQIIDRNEWQTENSNKGTGNIMFGY